MTGSDIPYQLRPNKFIDRQIFMDLLARLLIPRGIENYIYVSMGGRHLVDHFAAYNKLGIQSQFSFDKDDNEVSRQIFNRPTGKTVCMKLESADLPSQIDNIFSQFTKKHNLIVWLDFTAREYRTQFQQAVQTLVRLRHGDVFRITVNASLERENGEWKKEKASSPAQYRASRLREKIAEFMPTDITEVGENALPETLARCLELVIRDAEREVPTLRIMPVLLTCYKDGAKMLTATFVVTEKSAEDGWSEKLVSRWKFASKDWSDIKFISVPVLSSREQHRLDLQLHRGKKAMLKALSFLPAKDIEASLEVLDSYRKFHRYYPTFRHVED